MDIDLLRTFLEVQRTRHFGHAAKSLFVTQSAVSSRIRLLEEMVGAQLFTRTRNDIQLTSAGKRLLKTAEAILHLWEEAKGTINQTEEDQQLLVVAGLTSSARIAPLSPAEAVGRELDPRAGIQVHFHLP